ncbi:NmrA-like family domain-containing protein [Trichoderma barbatum]
MADRKIITVIGATGGQGGGVVRTFLTDPALNQEWTVRAVTRDPSKEIAQLYKEQGAEVIIANLDDKSSLLKAFSGATAVFAVTNYWEHMNVDIEIQQGKNIVDAETGVPHLVWSSLRNVKKLTKGKISNVHHFDGKAEVEDYARITGIPATFFQAGWYMQNLAHGLLRQNVPDGPFLLSMPIPDRALIPVFDVANTGIWVKAIIRNRDQLLGKRVSGATKYMTPTDIVDEFRTTFSEAGKDAVFNRLTNEGFLGSMIEAGYFAFELLDESLAILEDEPTSLAKFLKQSPAFQNFK